MDDMASCSRESSRSIRAMASAVMPFNRFGVCGVTNCACGVPANIAPRTDMDPRVKNPETGAYPECSASSCKSLQHQISRKSAEIPPTFQRAFLNRECASSNPPRSARQSVNWRLYSRKSHKCPPIAVFCRLARRLQAPNSDNLRAKSPIVSGKYLKYSRFWETATGDRVRSGLLGG